MPAKPMTFEVPEGFEQTATRFFAFLQEMQDAADRTPDADVLDTCEGVAMTQGRAVQQEALRQALQDESTARKKRGAEPRLSLWTRQRKSGTGHANALELYRADHLDAPLLAVSLWGRGELRGR